MWGVSAILKIKKWEGSWKSQARRTLAVRAAGRVGAMECKCAFFPIGLKPVRCRLYWKCGAGVSLETFLLGWGVRC